ncbi:MAG: chemotaxis protein CheW [Caldibacillus thermoamylovorans]|jgi:two-component system chemotaxis response regulator CheV|uniref:chemotaxis protein CheW n=1 Tax=Bacillaceae TaxID=186817 RepID=UPI001D06E023|nr:MULTISPECIES: chemotaxis protein CheW [Bacillaceae]MCB5933877.1 chemotaxis protein CheW [Bacillus sp. DFI.2.34]MCB7075828.1 chemotaxis protein CheW [Caldibacillus thermoamylovorans]MDL0418623.1 chemotaxis protein CheW [Caldibacillus thermoamylovorans]MED3644833.1 chemotaxis protein CheW [Caldifermentibacillus hisashii]
MKTNENHQNTVTLPEEMMLVEFYLGKEFFGIPVKNVNEIIMPTQVTPVPRSKPYIEGITDIRGEVLPVIDLAMFLSIPVQENSEQDRFIVTEISEQRAIFHVSGVEQILSVTKIEKPNDLSNRNQFVSGVIRNQEQIVLLLDFEKMFNEIIALNEPEM